ncbi:twin-arginine translocation signal domain-containing protein, partial [Streptomyces albus]
MPVIESTETPLQSTKDVDGEFTRLIDSLTRRGFLTGAAALGALGALSACSSESSGTETSDEWVDIVVADQAYRLPRDPKRVVVLEARGALDFALLAEYPIVATNWDPKSQLMQQVPAGAARLGGTNNEPNAESILSFDPDLLVVGKGWWGYYQDKGLLGTDIAPVLVVDEGTTGSSWKQAMTAQLTAL